MKTTCIVCPVGCQLNIEKIDGEIVVTGNGCMRGIPYGKSEFECPKRIVTAIIRGKKQICSIKTTIPVEKKKLNEVLKLLKFAPDKKFKVGEIMYKNIFGSGADIVVTSIQDEENC